MNKNSDALTFTFSMVTLDTGFSPDMQKVNDSKEKIKLSKYIN